MSDSANQAVFLSYASQDAEAARRICEALRGAGIAVWFDADGGLEHGDEWDAKIRKQIKECVLFIPIISANTQARLEGYFRLEWELAAQRAMSIASGVPFILPVVIDATPEPAALVPDRFRMVQWTKLPGGMVTPEVTTRYLKLWSHRLGVLKATELQLDPNRPADGGGSVEPAPPRKVARRFSPVVWTGAAMAAIALITVFALRPKPHAGADSRPSHAENSPRLSEAQQLVARARELTSKMDYTRADLELAEGYARKAVDLDQGLAEAWGVRAFVNAGYIMRGFAIGDERSQRAKDAQTYANRALVLNPDEPDALVALAKVLTGSVSEALLQQAVAKNPHNLRAALALGEDLRAKRRLEEAQVVFEEAARRHPTSVGAHYDLSGNYLRMGNLAKAWDEIVAAVELQPFMRGLVIKAYLAGLWKGDLALMRATLEQIAPADRTEDRAVYMAMWCGLLERRPERVLEAAAQTSRDYLVDATGFYTGPKALLIAAAHVIGGRENLARQQWQAAETLLRRRLGQEPQNLEDTLMLATTLVWLGQEDEARRIAEPVELAWAEQMSHARGERLAAYYAVRRDGDKVAHYLRAVANERSPIRVTKVGLRLDPCWDRVRGQPAFEALLREEEGAVASGGTRGSEKGIVAAEKSVAVLAFENRSDDRSNDYFSDGIGEELINVLGKVPGLKVTARTGSYFFKGKSVPISEIAEKLGVAYVVEGSVRKQGDQVRIIASLIKAADGTSLWGDTFTREAKDVFAVQEEIAGRIAKELSLKLGVSSAAATAAINPEAFELYVQARQEWNQRTMPAYRRAEVLLHRALALEPKFARAHAALADAWGFLAADGGEIGTFGRRDSPEFARLRAQVDRALELDPDLAEAHATLGNLLLQQGRTEEAVQALRRAVALNPNYATGQQWLGRALQSSGRFDEAREALGRAAALDPFSHRILDNYASLLQQEGRDTEALALLDRALALQPDALQATMWKALSLSALGRHDEAVALVRKRPYDDTPYVAEALKVLMAAGRKEEATQMLERNPNTDRFRALVALGRPTEALGAVKLETMNIGSFSLAFIDPAYDAIREDPRYVALIAELGLAEAHARARAWRAKHPVEKGGRTAEDRGQKTGAKK